ncbi:MAG: C40 family peptidase [Treponema sp.]|nr:C40 family peptidase [Treponema sp.]
MKDYTKEAQKSLENYSDFLEAQGCGKEEMFHNLLAEFNGTPYVWGDESTESSDCSGTVCASLNALYKKNVRVTADSLYRNYFTSPAEDYDGIQAAFFLNKEGKAVHVAGYMGRGLFMNESSLEANGGTPRTMGELKRMYSSFLFTRRKLKEEQWA